MAESDLRRSVAEPVPVPTLVLSLHHRCPLSRWGVGEALGSRMAHPAPRVPGVSPHEGINTPRVSGDCTRAHRGGAGDSPTQNPEVRPWASDTCVQVWLSHYITEETAGGGERHARVTSYQNLQAPSPEPSLEQHSPAAVTRLLLMHGTSGPHYWGHTQAGSRRCLQGACETAARMTPGAGTAHTPRVRGA